MMAKYFLAAVRTGGAGGAGISMLLLERGPGLTTRPVYTQTGPLAGTAYVILVGYLKLNGARMGFASWD